MANLTSVGVTAGVPTSGTGTVSTIDNLIAVGLPISNGTNTAAIKPASTAAGATDPALVVAVSPNGLGQNVAANSSSVVLASDNNNVTPVGNIASLASDSGNPVKVGSVYNASNVTASTGQRVDLQSTVHGAIRVALETNNLGVTATANSSDGGGAQTALYTNGYGISFNGTGWDRLRNNIDTAALVTLSSQTAGTVNSTDQTNFNGRGVQVGINVTASTAATLTISIQGKDVASGTYYTILSSTAIATTGFTNLTVYPGAATTANSSISEPLPRTWRIQAVVTGTSVSATVGASVIV